MKFVIKCDKDKQTLINYLKELGNDYLVDVKETKKHKKQYAE